MATTQYKAGESVRYVGPDTKVEPVNRTVMAGYGPNADILSFRAYRSFGQAEVLTSRGSRIVPLTQLEPVK